jgi:hypothetical protein
MYRLIWLPALALAACGTDDDRRPRTVEYITQAILAPNCGNAQCHSQFTQAHRIVLDTVEHAQPHLAGMVGQITLDPQGEFIGTPEESMLIDVLTRDVDRMPYDQGLPEPDIDLIRRWIEFGAPGAQCDPAVFQGKACAGGNVVECLPSFNYGEELEDCGTRGCAAGVCQ